MCGTGRSANCGALLNPNNADDAGGPYSDGNYLVYDANAVTWTGTTSGYTGPHSAPLVLSSANQYGPSNAWADYSSGKWVSLTDSTAPDPGCTQNANSTACSYQALYVISFTIPMGLDPALVHVSGSWTGDDTGHMVVNGTSLSGNSPSQGGQLADSCGTAPFCGASAGLTSFTLSNAVAGVSFVTGTNYVGFQVDQADDYYDGVVVDSLTASTPEPATWTLFAAGVLALGVLRRRRA